MLDFETPNLWLDRTADNSDYAVIGPTDGRTRVLNSRASPYSAVCHVERDFGNGRFSGCSGFLVAPNIVITAGHCLHSAIRARLRHRATPARIRVTPGRNGPNPPFGAFIGTRWYVPRRFVSHMDRESDYGILVLDRPVPPAVRPLALRALSDIELQQVRAQRLLHIAGYPGDKPHGTMWEHAERLDRHTQRSLFYSIDTCPGHSGSAIWSRLQQSGPATVIGIHVAGPTPHARGPWGCRPGVPMAPAGMFNRGIRVTPLIVSQTASVRANRSSNDLQRLI